MDKLDQEILEKRAKALAAWKQLVADLQLEIASGEKKYAVCMGIAHDFLTREVEPTLG
jgi:hypothetical protein